MTTKIILCDVDGVLLDWKTGFHDYMEMQGHEITNNANVWLMHNYYENISADIVYNNLEKFNNSKHIATLEPMYDAVSGVSILYDAGYDFHAITSMSTNQEIIEMRQSNLDQVFGENVFSKLIVAGHNKHDDLVKYKDSNLVWIEDKVENAITGADVGLNSILLDQEYNQTLDDPRVTRVSNWNDICKIVLV